MYSIIFIIGIVIGFWFCDKFGDKFKSSKQRKMIIELLCTIAFAVAVPTLMGIALWFLAKPDKKDGKH